MSKKKIVIIVGVVLIVAGIIWNRIQASKAAAGKIETGRAEMKKITETISSSGKTHAREQADLHFQTYGKLAWVGVKEGDTVQEWQTLASLDIADLRKNLDKALRDYSKERNDFEQDRLDTYRYPALTDTIKRVLEKNQWDLEKAVMDVELKDIALRLAYLTTPIAGIITHIDTPIAGVNVTATSTFTVVNPQSLVFTSNVDEVDVGKIKPNQNAEVRLDAYPDDTFKGQVLSIAYAAEISAGGATVFPVDVSFNRTDILRNGLNGDVTFIIREEPNAISISQDAIRENEKEKYVIKKINNNYVKQTVRTGINDDNNTQIIEGLAAGDEVVTKGFEYLPKDLQ